MGRAVRLKAQGIAVSLTCTPSRWPCWRGRARTCNLLIQSWVRAVRQRPWRSVIAGRAVCIVRDWPPRTADDRRLGYMFGYTREVSATGRRSRALQGLARSWRTTPRGGLQTPRLTWDVRPNVSEGRYQRTAHRG